MLELMKMPSQYPADFEAFWKAYKSPDVKNGAKKTALTAWTKARKRLPPLEILLCCVEAYDNWLAAERAKNKNGFPAKCHAATFLSPLQDRWESFLDDAEIILQARKGGLRAHLDAEMAAIAKTWEGAPRAALLAHIGEDEFSCWFARCAYINTDGYVEIRTPSTFHASEMEKRFGKVIRKAFGPATRITVTGQEKGPTR